MARAVARGRGPCPRQRRNLPQHPDRKAFLSSGSSDRPCLSSRRSPQGVGTITPMLQRCNVRALESPRSRTQITGIGSFRRSPEQGPSPAYAGHCGSLIPPLRAAASFRVKPPWFPLRHGGIFLPAILRWCTLFVYKSCCLDFAAASISMPEMGAALEFEWDERKRERRHEVDHGMERRPQ